MDLSPTDLERFAEHLGLTEKQAVHRHCYIHPTTKELCLKQVKDKLLKGSCCKFLDQKTRRCTIYEGRPDTCRAYPSKRDCVYFDLLESERERQDDPKQLIQITFL